MTDNPSSQNPYTTWQDDTNAQHQGYQSHQSHQSHHQSSSTQPYQEHSLSYQSFDAAASSQYPDPESFGLGENAIYELPPESFFMFTAMENNFCPAPQDTLSFNSSMSPYAIYVPDLAQYGQYPFMPPTYLPSSHTAFPQPVYQQQWPQHQQQASPWVTTSHPAPMPTQGSTLPTSQAQVPFVPTIPVGVSSGISSSSRAKNTTSRARSCSSSSSSIGSQSSPLPLASQRGGGGVGAAVSGAGGRIKKVCTKARGEGVPIWEGYPGPKQPMPKGLTLYQIANQYPNHLAGEVLDDFVRARWSAPEIQSCMPQECQDWLEKRKNNNDERIVDKTMWLQKRLQKRRKLLVDGGGSTSMSNSNSNSNSSNLAKLRAFWETPQRRRDGRPRDVVMGASLKPPQTAFLQKNHLINTGPTFSNGKFHGQPAWIEPPGTSYFRLDPNWGPPAASSGLLPSSPQSSSSP